MSITLTDAEPRANLTKMVVKRIDLNYVDGFVRIVLSVRQLDGTEGREHEFIIRANTPDAADYLAAVSPAPSNLRSATESWLVSTNRLRGTVD